MPQPELMVWIKSERRWQKKYRGKRYAVSPRQLGTDPTKEASRQAANSWWEKKQAEIDNTLGAAKKHPAAVVKEYQGEIEQFRLYAKWQRRYGVAEEAERAEAAVERLTEALKSDDPPFPLEAYHREPAYHEIYTGNEGKYPNPWDDPNDEEYLRNEYQAEMWRERLAQIKREEQAEKAVPKENTVRVHVDEYLKFRKARVAVGKNTLGTFDTYRGRLLVFRKWIDPSLPVEALNEATWERFYVYLAGQVQAGDMSQSTMVGTLGAAREFIRSRWERRFIELPRNLHSRSLAVSAPLKQIEVFSTEEIQTLLKAASERERLYLLLMLNFGAYPVDIAALRQDEVNWSEGRIFRKRTKTRGRSEAVPMVDYRLWKTAFDLLVKNRSSHPELVLLNERGSPLWTEKEGTNGWVIRNSNIRCAFSRLQKKTEITKPLKLLRKTSATKLEEHSEYGRYAEYFLGEAPSSVASRHYVKPSKEQFDAAVQWLGEQFGIK